MTRASQDRIVPRNWEMVPLGRLGDWTGGGTPSKGNLAFWRGGHIPWVSPKDMKVDRIRDSEDHITKEAVAHSAAKLVPPGCVLVVTRSGILAHTLPVAVSGVAVTVNQDLKALEPAPGVSGEYVAKALQAFASDILDRCTKHGTTVHSVEVPKFLAYEIPVAPTAEQCRVVETIDSYLTRLEATSSILEKVRANLKRYRAAVLQAAVSGRLVPTEAELARQEGRDYEPASFLLERILEERRRRWEDMELARPRAQRRTPGNDRWKRRYRQPTRPTLSDLPSIPDGWCWVTWGQIGLSQNGRAFPSDQYQSRGVKLLRPGNLHASGRVDWTIQNTKYLSEMWAHEHPAHVIGPDELVMNLTAQSLKDEFLGRVCLTGPGDVSLLNQRLARLTPILVDTRFMFWVFKSPLFRSFVNSLNTGSLIEHMFTSQLAECLLPLPPLGEQARIAAEIERLLSLVRAAEDVAERGASSTRGLEHSILRWAFEGRLVDQDPADEPASVLLDRICADREEARRAPRAPASRTRRGRTV